MDHQLWKLCLYNISFFTVFHWVCLSVLIFAEMLLNAPTSTDPKAIL